jgi:hypothetical protein
MEKENVNLDRRQCPQSIAYGSNNPGDEERLRISLKRES